MPEHESEAAGERKDALDDEYRARFQELGCPPVEAEAVPLSVSDAAARRRSNGSTFLRQAAPRSGAPVVLSTRQLEVLQLLASGFTQGDIALRLHLSTETVRTHVRDAVVRSGARTRVQAVAWAVAAGHIVIGEPPPVGVDGSRRRPRG